MTYWGIFVSSYMILRGVQKNGGYIFKKGIYKYRKVCYNRGMREEIIALLARLQQSKGSELDQHNLREITADRIIALIVHNLPGPIDIDSKYELNGQPISLTIDTERKSEEENMEQISHVARFANDQGYNRFRGDYITSLQNLYNVVE